MVLPQKIFTARSQAAGLSHPQRSLAGEAIHRRRRHRALPRAGAAAAGGGADGPRGPPGVGKGKCGENGWKNAEKMMGNDGKMVGFV